MGKNAGLDLSRYGRRTKPGCPRFIIERRRIAYEGCAIRAAEGERIVVLNAVACWTAFHFSNASLELAFFPSNGLATTCKLTACTTSASQRAGSNLRSEDRRAMGP